MKTRGQQIAKARQFIKETNADSRMTDRFIWSIIDPHIRWMIKRESGNLKIMHYDTIFQTLKGVPVEQVSTIDECIDVKTKCTIYRTVFKLPSIYEDEDGVIIKSVFSIDGSNDFIPIKINEYMRKLEDPNSKYDKSKYYFYNNGYLYFPNHRIDKVMIKALFEYDLENICSTCPAPSFSCKSFSEHQVYFPDKLEGELWSYVEKDLIAYKQIPTDEQIDKNENRKS